MTNVTQEREAALERREARRKVPLPVPVVRPSGPDRMESPLGSYEGVELPDGRYLVDLRFRGTVSRGVYLFFLGALRSLLFPEVDR